MQSKLKCVILLLAAAIGCMITPVAMANSLTPTVVAFGGSFETDDPGTSVSCVNANKLAGSCLCPGGTSPAYAFRILNDTEGGGTKHGGWVKFCSSGMVSGEREFAGAFQIDDPVASGQSCRFRNASTGACSCPTGTTSAKIRTLADADGKVIGSTIHLCMKTVATPVAFGGAYQVDDPSPGSLGCRSQNPYTGGCGCPAGFDIQPHRVLVDTATSFIGSTLYTCVPPVMRHHLCPGLLADPGADLADPTGGSAANVALQKCIDAQPKGGVLEIPAGNYRLTDQVRVSGPETIRTQGTAGAVDGCLGATACAILFADPSFYVQGGLLSMSETSNVTLDHIVLDGNRSARIGSKAYSECKAGHNVWGFNARAHNCTTCSFTNSASINALCGSGFEWRGDNATIRYSAFMNNGNHFDSRAWSDGLTLLQSDNAVVTNNQFIDNSDVGFISGGGINAHFKNNVVVQQAMTAFAAFMLDNFNGATSGDFTGSEVSGNKIQCDKSKCLYGMNIGPHAWYPSKNLMGGSIVSNIISGGTIALNVDGAGTPENPVYIFGNTLETEQNPMAPTTPRCKNLRSAGFSASSDTSMRTGSTVPGVVQSVHGCVGQTSW